MGGIRAWVSAAPPKIRGLLCFDCFLLPRTHSPYPARAPGGRRPDESETEDGPPPRLPPGSSEQPHPHPTLAMHSRQWDSGPEVWRSQPHPDWLVPHPQGPSGETGGCFTAPRTGLSPGLVLPHVSDRWLGLFRVRTTPGSRGRGVCHWEEREDASRAQKGARSGLHAMLCSSGGNASVGTFIIGALFCGYIVL